jgi:hypothetical protein
MWFVHKYFSYIVYIYYVGNLYTLWVFFCYLKNKVKELVRKSNKGISTMIALIGMIALLVSFYRVL